jgi:AGZA family xanthine/uracil permease-like MFS transporter
MLERIFALKQNGTTVPRELVAGITTFTAMAYILAVNPLILSSTGMDKGALITATALASAVMTIVFALATNYPIALAPGMGLNAFFAFTMVASKGLSWQSALGLVFYEGLIFLLLSISGFRRRLIDAIPLEMKVAITAGIGFFIALIGLKNGGVIVPHPVTFITLGDMSKPGPLLVILGVILTAVLVIRKTPGAIVLVVVALTVVGFVVPAADGKGMLTQNPTGILNLPSSLAPTFGKLDLIFPLQHFFEVLPLLLALLFVDLFDNMGTLIGVAKRAGLADAQGNIPKIGPAFLADASAAMFGSVVGTSTVTSYIESAAGVEAGGRTGLSTIFTAICFLLALFLTPLILIIPSYATAPALVVVGVFMLQGLAELDLTDFSKAAPAFVTIIGMPLAFSISEGLALGLVTFVGIKIGTGKWKEIGIVTGVLAFLFVLHFIFGR